MAEPVTWAAVGMALVGNVGAWLKIIYDGKKKNSKNGKMCVDDELPSSRVFAEIALMEAERPAEYF